MTPEELKRSAAITEGLNQFLIKVSAINIKYSKTRDEMLRTEELSVDQLNKIFDDVMNVAKVHGVNILEVKP